MGRAVSNCSEAAPCTVPVRFNGDLPVFNNFVGANGRWETGRMLFRPFPGDVGDARPRPGPWTSSFSSRPPYHTNATSVRIRYATSVTRHPLASAGLLRPGCRAHAAALVRRRVPSERRGVLRLLRKPLLPAVCAAHLEVRRRTLPRPVLHVEVYQGIYLSLSSPMSARSRRRRADRRGRAAGEALTAGGGAGRRKQERVPAARDGLRSRPPPPSY